MGKKISAAWEALTIRTPADAPSDTKRLDALRDESKRLRELAGQAQGWAEEATDELDTAVCHDEQWSAGVQTSLTEISGQLEGLETELATRSKAKDVVAFISGRDGKDSLRNLRKEIDCLIKSITKDRDERQQISTHAQQWVALAGEMEEKLVAIDEIVVDLAEVAVSRYYESARQRISSRYRSLWVGFWFLTAIVVLITLIPEVRNLIRSEVNIPERGATDALINFLSTRVGTLTILGAALFTLRTSLRRTEKTEKEYETKALRLKTTIVAKESGLGENLLQGIAVAIQPDSDDEESDSS